MLLHPCIISNLFLLTTSTSTSQSPVLTLPSSPLFSIRTSGSKDPFADHRVLRLEMREGTPIYIDEARDVALEASLPNSNSPLTVIIIA